MFFINILKYTSRRNVVDGSFGRYREFYPQNGVLFSILQCLLAMRQAILCFTAFFKLHSFKTTAHTNFKLGTFNQYTKINHINYFVLVLNTNLHLKVGRSDLGAKLKVM